MAESSRQLPRVLSFLDFSVLASAAMGPAYSIASTAGVMIATAGVFAPHALLLQTAVMGCIAVAFWRLAEVEPNAGSSYSWVRSAFGARAGAYAAWLLILANYFATMATAVPAGTYTLDLIAPHLAAVPLSNAIVGCVWILACAALLYLGARPTAFVTMLMLVAELVVLFVLTLRVAFGPHVIIAIAPEPGAPTGGGFPIAGFLTASVLAIWMVDGWEVSASTSEEARGSARTPGAGGLWGLLLTCAILLVCMIALLHAFTPAALAGHQADVLAYVGAQLGGVWGPVIVATVLVSTAATLSTTMLYLSRSLYAMGRDGVVPRALGRLDRRGDPSVALGVTTIGVAVSTLLTGLWPSAAAALQFILGGSSVFLGGLFVFSAIAAARRFWGQRGSQRLTGVVIPLAGGAALFALLVATTLGGDTVLRATVLIGLALGLPFAVWRARPNVPISG